MILPIGANIVIIASNYNPSIVSKEWLYQKKIFTEPVGNFVHTPPFSLVENENFHLTIDEARFQIAVKKVTVDSLNAMASMAETFVKILSETPYKAVGFNYHYDVPREKCDLDTILSPDNERIRELLSSEFDVGATLRFKVEDFTTILTIQPSFGKQRQSRVSFNFHSDIASVTELRKRLTSQTALRTRAETILEGLTKNA